MGQATLGIWIPTFNRPQFFNRLIGSIEPDPLLTVATGINGSADGYDIPDWCHAIHNPANIGQSLNILLGVSELDTDYLWILGDDERVKPGGVAEVIDRIQARPGMVICTDGRFPHGADGDFPTWADWADACTSAGRGVMITAQTLISATVFRRAGLRMSTAYAHLPSKYGHHFGMLDGLADEPVTVTTRPVFTAGHNTDSHIHHEPWDVREAHGPTCQASLRHLISWVNDRTGRSYDVAASYQPGVGFDS
jgi:hypothetical protein